ncbi:site-2 protease family protein [Xanthobacter oligotrophicus]|uniref:site-2 protease family protein n=1 Tax=Xanthobacter oligotrophicus TaxID=2607286 RepID=UPI0011F3FF66|nr:site-2 protease family protein [Xanthobacter oligotrophicus]MCG5234993.1 site-2 protease family protein [Xanthobacter oligotrophicus]
MPWSLTIGRLGETAIRIHVTFLLFLVWIWAAYYRSGGSSAAWEGVLFVALLFACVLLHELGHVFAARRYGVKTPDITLWPFGGIANLERIPEKPSQELVVAIAGPLVNVVIALVLLVILSATLGGTDLTADSLAKIEDPRTSILVKLAGANIFLVVFNLIPAFPMDGGRVLRALLAMKMGHAKATATAASIGQGLAIGMGLLGIFTNPMLMIIGVFVFLAASGEAGQVQLKEASRGLLVSDAMITHFETLGPQSTVDDAADALIRSTQKEFPVVDGAGHLRGVLTRDAMIRAMKDQGPQTAVIEVMQADIPVVEARSKLDAALKLITSAQVPAVGVVDVSGKLVGLLTPENVGELMMLHAARPERGAHPFGRGRAG